MDKKWSIDAIYLDFAKAFDTVSHKKLLHKLKAYGVGGKLWEWIEAFLSGRTQKVSVGNTFSESSPVLSGIPQGTILAPILFVLFINDLPDILCSSKVNLFADDIKIYKEIKNSDDCLLLQSDLDRIYEWSETWQLQLASYKCQTFSLGYRNETYRHTINGEVLKKTSCLRDLGIFLNKNLKPSLHIDKICSSARQKISFLFKIFRTKNVNALKQAYVAYIRSQLEYNSPVWSPSFAVDVDKLEKVQKWVTRKILSRCGLDPVPYDQRLKLLKLESLEKRRRKADLCMCFALLKNIYDENIDTLFTLSHAQHTRGHPLKLTKPRLRTDVRKHSFCARIVQFWNSLSNEIIRSTQSVQSFRKKLDNETDAFRNLRWE